VLFFSVCLILLGLFKLILAFSPFGFQGFWSSLLSLFWILFQVAAYFLFIYLGLCFPSLFLHLCSISLPFLFFFFFFDLFCFRSPFPRLQWLHSFFLLVSDLSLVQQFVEALHRVKFVLSVCLFVCFFSYGPGSVRW